MDLGELVAHRRLGALRRSGEHGRLRTAFPGYVFTPSVALQGMIEGVVGGNAPVDKYLAGGVLGSEHGGQVVVDDDPRPHPQAQR